MHSHILSLRELINSGGGGGVGASSHRIVVGKKLLANLFTNGVMYDVFDVC